MRQLTNRVTRSGVIALLLSVPLLGAHVASAGAAVAVSGQITVTANTVGYEFQVGSDKATVASARVTFTGNLKGRAIEDYVTVTHADGSADQYGFGIFRGKINGKAGTVYYKFKGVPARGSIRILSGTRGLAGLRGTIRYRATGGPNFSYSGRVRDRR
jgi:hypothetical protein